MKRVLIAVVALLGVLATSSESATITGRIINSEDGSVVSGATITVEDAGRQLTTDLNGYFLISSGDGKTSISVSHVGFATLSNVSLAPGRENLIELSPAISRLNPIVVTAKRFEKESFKVPQPVTVFDASDIQKKGHTTVTEIIRHSAGMDMSDTGPFRTRPVIRGLFGTRVLVLVDGERLNDQRDVVDFAGISMSLIDVNEIDRVEVLNGPSSVLYGSDAMGGVINIFTNQHNFSDVNRPFVSYSSKYSTADERSSNRFSFGIESEKYILSAGFLYQEANNDLSPPDNWQTDDPRFGVFRKTFYDSLNAARGTSWSTEGLVNSRARVNNFDFGAALKLNDNHRLDLDVGAFRGSDIGFPGVPNDSTPFFFGWPNHDRDNFSIAYSGRGFRGKFATIDARFYYQKISKDFFTDFMDGIVIFAGPPPNPPTITPLTSFSTTEVQKFGLNLQSLYQLNPHATITFGVDSWREEIDGDVTSIALMQGFGPFPFNDTTESASVPKNKWHSVGAFASSDFDLKPLLITAGARFDNFWLNTELTPGYVDDNDNPLPSADQTYSSVNGSLGIVWSLTKYVNAVGNVGTAYRVPNVVERFFYGSASGRETRPNPDIKPERSVSLDLGFKSAHKEISYSLIGFYSKFTHFTQLRMFGTDPLTFQPLWRFENVDDVSIYGFEAVIESRLSNGVTGGLTFSYQRGNNDSEDEPVFVSPVKTSITLGYQPPEKDYFGEINVHRVEEQNRIPSAATLDDIATEGFTLVNTMFGVKLWNQLLVSLNVHNVFDEVYSQPFNARNPDNPVPESGRNFVLSVKADVGI